MRFLLAFLLAAAALHAQRPPNVVLMLSDDQGTVDIDIFGAHDLHTPNLNRLASEGTRFTQFYVGAPVCSPSRASLLTGRYPQRAGVPNNIAPGGVGMPPEQVTMAEVFKAAGYETAIVGKWHLGSAGADGPLTQGFDYFYGHMRGCIDNYSHFFYWRGPNEHDLWRNTREVYEDGTHFSDLMVREATEFIDDNRDRPFFLYLPFNIPHYPLQGKAKWRTYYRDMASPRKHYAALVSTLDEQAGKVIAKINDLGLRENTLIVFLSDHGHATEERTMFGGGSAGPYRGAKFSLLEGGIRVPAVVSLPGVIPQDEVRSQFATALDWMPTIAEIAGIDPPSVSIDGKSLMGVIADADAPSPHTVFHWQRGNQWAVRDGDWKLVVNGLDTNRDPLEGDEEVFLSDLDYDASETRSLAKDRPEIVKRLTDLHEQWAASLE